MPADLKQLIEKKEGGEPVLMKLLREFYLKSGVKELIPKYTAVGQAYATAYRRPVGEVVFKVFDYFHTRPETSVSMKPLVITKERADKSKKQEEKVVARTRTRYVFVLPDPLAALNTSIVRDDFLVQKDELLTRRPGDDYIITIGPSRTHTLDAVRQALIRFAIDPIVERHLRAALEYKDPIVKLVAGIPTASKQFAPSVYLVIRESLAQAAEARMKRIEATRTRGSYSEDDAVYDLAQAYQSGAALVFHFYDSLKGLEQVGINIEDFFDQMVATTNFEREAGRAQQFEPVVARVTAARKAAATKAASAKPDPLAGTVAAKLVLTDDLIRQRRYDEAKKILEEILGLEPKNARALYGMAQVVNNAPSAVEADPKADEDDKIQAQYNRLEAAIKLYRQAIENASPETEAWLIQWSHVLIGRILDFQEFRNDAIAEYEKAIALGDIPNGAYREALEGKQRPYGQKQ